MKIQYILLAGLLAFGVAMPSQAQKIGDRVSIKLNGLKHGSATLQKSIDGGLNWIDYSEIALNDENTFTFTLKEKAQYRVRVADGSCQTIYSTATPEIGDPAEIVDPESFDFETWIPGVEGQEPENTFYEVAGGWSSSNTGAHLLKVFQLTDKYVVTETDDAQQGAKAAKIVTIDSKGQDMVFAKIPKITSGSLFLGKFETDMGNTLNSTKFGIKYGKKPTHLKGYYKYTPGAVYYRCDDIANCHLPVEDPTKTDECSIAAVLYEVSDYEETLTGVDLYESEKVVAVGTLSDGTAKAEYTPFDIKLEYKKEYDLSKKYKFVIVCSSSKDGDKFSGAPESTLIVDNFEVVTDDIYTFEEWVAGVEGQEPENTFYEVAGGWSSSNTGAHLLKVFQLADKYVVTETDDAQQGTKAAKIITIDSKGQDMVFAKIPKITSGSLFLGKFETDMGNTLNSTKFGVKYTKKPLTLKGYYKYTPGAVYYRCDDIANCHLPVEDPTKTDECSIAAVLYEVSDYEETLTGVDLYESEKVVAVGTLSDGTAKADYTPFSITMTYTKPYDPAKKYKFVIVCSSSKDGDKFSGAPESTLIVDSFEVICE